MFNAIYIGDNETSYCISYIVAHNSIDMQPTLSGICRISILRRPFLGEGTVSGNGACFVSNGKTYFDYYG